MLLTAKLASVRIAWGLLGLAALLLCGALAAIAFGGFHGSEDAAALTSNQYIIYERSQPPSRLWQVPYGDRYAPVPLALWRAVAALSSTGHAADGARVLPAEPFHALSIVVHVASGVLLYLLLRRLRLSSYSALFGSLLFLCHPLQVEAISWISAYTYPLAAALSLLALNLYLWGMQSARAGRLCLLVLASAVALLAMLTQIDAVVLPLLAWLLPRGDAAERLPSACLRWWMALAGLVLGVDKWVATRAQWVPVIPWVQRPRLYVGALAHYAQSIVWPAALAPDYRYPTGAALRGLAAVSPALAGGGMLVLVALCLACHPVARPWRRPLLFASVALLPHLLLTAKATVNSAAVADRYAYAAMVGVAWAAALLAERLRRHPAFAWAGGIAVLLLAALSVAQAQRWRQPAALLAQTLAVNPRSWWAHEDYGRAELAAGHPEAAVLSLQRAAALSPGRFQAWHLLGMAATQLGRPEAAIAAFSSAVASAPLESGEFLALANSQAALGQLAAAEPNWRRAVALSPDTAAPALALGTFLVQQGRDQEAGDYLRQAARLNPDQPSLQALYGDLQLRLGRDYEAERAYRLALQGGVEAPEVYAGLGLVLLRRGEFVEAERALLEALARRPDLVTARAHLLEVYAHLGRTRAALQPPAPTPQPR